MKRSTYISVNKPLLHFQAAQLEAEKQRQREWEKRRKEELLNQKGLEENIVNELKTRLTKLKSELATQVKSLFCH